MGVPAFVSENKVPSFGVAYDLRDRVVLKAQFTRINRSTDNPNAPTGPGFNIGCSVECMMAVFVA